MKNLEQQIADKKTALKQALKNDQFTMAAMLRDDIEYLKEDAKTQEVRKYAL